MSKQKQIESRSAAQPCHLVWRTNGGIPFLVGHHAWRVLQLARDTCRKMGSTLLKGRAFGENVHLFISVPKYIDSEYLLKRLKEDTAMQLLEEFPELLKTFSQQSIWDDSGFCKPDSPSALAQVYKFLGLDEAASVSG